MSDVIIHSMDYVLTETNYKDWYEDFKLELDGAGLGEYVERDIEEIINETTAKYTDKHTGLSEEGEEKIRKHKMNNSKVISFTKRSVNSKIKAFIKNKTEEKKSAYALIKLLEKKYKEEELNEIPKLYRKLENLNASNEKEVINYIDEFLEIIEKLSELNIKLNNREKLTYLYKGLPEKQINFLEIRCSISDDIDKILEDMKKQIRNRQTYIHEDEKEVSFISRNDSRSKYSKLNTHHNKHGKSEYHHSKHHNKEFGKKRYSQNNNHYRNSNDNFGNNSYNRKNYSNKKYCFICNNENHLAFKCPFNPKNPNNKIKVIAKKFSQLNLREDELNDIEFCYDNDTSSSETETREINSIEIQSLREESENEEIPEIPLYETNNLNFINRQHTPKNAGRITKNISRVDNIIDKIIPPIINKIVTNDENKEIIKQYIETNSCNCIGVPSLLFTIDSGASVHVTNSIEFLKDIREYKINLILPNKAKIRITKIGTLSGYINNKPFEIEDVLYSKELNKNLISYSILRKAGYLADYILIDDNIYFRLANKNQNLLCIAKENDANICNIIVSKRWNINNDQNIYNLELDDYSEKIWHLRLCHFYNNNLRKYLEGHNIKKSNCIDCKSSKLKKAPLNKSTSHASRPLELIHSDVLGLLKLSRNNYKYVITFLDDYSRKSWIYLMKKISEVTDIFTHFVKMVSNEQNLTVVKIQSDNRKEYTSNKFVTFCSENGIQRRLIVPSNPQSNGRAEKLNGTLENAVKVMLS